MGFAEGMGVAACIIITYLMFHDVTIALVSGLVFLGFITKGDKE